MRIYNDDDNELIDEMEITLSLEEAKDFYFRINDAAHNPSYKHDEYVVSDFIEGDIFVDEDGRNHIIKSVQVAIYTNLNFTKFPEFAKSVIKFDKV